MKKSQKHRRMVREPMFPEADDFPGIPVENFYSRLSREEEFCSTLSALVRQKCRRRRTNNQKKGVIP